MQPTTTRYSVLRWLRIAQPPIGLTPDSPAGSKNRSISSGKSRTNAAALLEFHEHKGLSPRTSAIMASFFQNSKNTLRSALDASLGPPLVNVIQVAD